MKYSFDAYARDGSEYRMITSLVTFEPDSPAVPFFSGTIFSRQPALVGIRLRSLGKEMIF